MSKDNNKGYKNELLNVMEQRLQEAVSDTERYDALEVFSMVIGHYDLHQEDKEILDFIREAYDKIQELEYPQN